MAPRLLLISNSTQHGEGYLDHCFAEIEDFLGEIDRFLFVPFALADREGYWRAVRDRFAPSGRVVDQLVEDEEGGALLRRARAVFVGGGNTFRLLATVRRSGFLEEMRRRVFSGELVYFGASAGSNLACPTIRTTNDMPIVEPGSFDALGAVPFQINPHYLDPDPGSRHMGETREQRLMEYLEENERAVVGLREGGWIRVEGRSAGLGGRNGARIFRRGTDPEERPPGADLSDLL
ncbi:MAG: dipeptidase PepE [Thermoanaerobaculia bacterium]|nr:dipeptidase PepE [Thermoanaerobaculia bacterium]